MNKFYYVSQWMTILLLSLGLGAEIFAQSPVRSNKNVLLDLTPFINAQRQLTLKNQQEHEDKLKQLSAPTLRSESASKPATPEPSKNAQAPECNCDDPSDSYNYPDNFVYSNDKQKLYRVNPYCKCSKSVTTYSGVTVNNALNPFSSGSELQTWNIKY